MSGPALLSTSRDGLERLVGAIYRDEIDICWLSTRDRRRVGQPTPAAAIWLADVAEPPAPAPRELPWPALERAAARSSVACYVADLTHELEIEREAELLGALLKQSGKLVLTLLDGDLAPPKAAEEFRTAIEARHAELRGAKWREVLLSGGAGVGELQRAFIEGLPAKNRVLAAGLLHEPPETLRSEIAEGRRRRAAKMAAVAGAVPLAGLDLLALVPLQIGLVREMARLHGHAVTRDQARDLLALLGAGYLTRGGLRQLTKAVPLLGSATGAAMASATTYALGRVADEYFRRGLAMNPDEIRRVFKEAVGRGAADRPAVAASPPKD